jgi:hypothetical protein
MVRAGDPQELRERGIHVVLVKVYDAVSCIHAIFP